MRGDHPVPQRLLVRHRLGQRHAQRRADRYVEQAGEAWPHVVPPEQVAVGDVERLVRAPGVGRGPDRGAGQQAGVGHLQQRVVGAGRPGEPQWHAQLLADRGVDGDHQHQVHRVAQRRAAHHRRAQRRPGPGSGPALQERLLRQVELGREMPGVLLPGRGGERPEVRAVDLVALHEAHVPQPGRCGLHRVHHVLQHGLVRSQQRRAGRSILVGGVEQVRDPGQPGEGVARALRVEQVGGDVPDPPTVRAAAAGEPHHLPVPECGQVLSQPVSDDAVRSDDQRRVRAHVILLGRCPERDPARPRDAAPRRGWARRARHRQGQAPRSTDRQTGGRGRRERAG